MSGEALVSIGGAMLEGLYQHRLLTTAQLRALYAPDASQRHARRLVAPLLRRGLVAAVRQPGGRNVLHLTPTGADIAETVPRGETRRKVLSVDAAAGPLQRHTLAVNEVGIAFVQAARERGDGFGPLSWWHEIAHPIGPPPGRRRREELIADALLVYQQTTAGGGSRFHYRLLELDRATMPTDALAEKLARYARLHDHAIPARPGEPWVRFWETRYPVFPTVLLVLAGARRELLLRRRWTALALLRDEPALEGVEITACLLEDLQQHGPFAPIWTSTRDLQHPERWLDEEPAR